MIDDDAYKLNQINEALENLANFYNENKYKTSNRTD